MNFPHMNSVLYRTSPYLHVKAKSIIQSIVFSPLTALTAAFAANLILFNSKHMRHYRPDNALFCTALVGVGIITWIGGRMGSYQSLEKGLGHLGRFSLVNTLTLKLNHYIHEWGHAGAALACFKKAEPVVIANSIFGHTEYNISYGLTRLGTLLGKERSRLVVTASGLAMPVFCAMAELLAAHRLKRHPKWQLLLRYHAISQLAEVFFYGLSSFYANRGKECHDFIHLWNKGGIHPIIPITLEIALPLAETAFLYYSKGKAEKQQSLSIVMH